ncbi:MAG: PIG-L family deacetylase [Cellulomonadaceae bacterium]|jgi:N-acetyl-1-D-myo-inositol-2-amino-2-deoxy-alpha-D-glucopyranoside deacetylase|nr:PIG-L family deacetylase [Cellulomonadaceae bacterium]
MTALQVEPRGTLLAVHAHPDDETLWTGALLATWAVAGQPVWVVTCTGGERGEVLALTGTASEGMERLEGDGPALAAWRAEELRGALVALAGGSGSGSADAGDQQGDAAAGDQRGGDPAGDQQGCDASEDEAGRSHPGTAIQHRFLGYEDSGMTWISPGVAGPDPSVTSGFANIPLSEAASALARIITEIQPTVVVTYDNHGGYGHPDHVRAHDATLAAVELVADRPEVWTAMTAESEGEGDRWVDVAPVLDRVMAAMRCHATQIQGITAESFALSNHVVQPIPAQERYCVVP